MVFYHSRNMVNLHILLYCCRVKVGYCCDVPLTKYIKFNLGWFLENQLCLSYKKRKIKPLEISLQTTEKENTTRDLGLALDSVWRPGHKGSGWHQSESARTAHRRQKRHVLWLSVSQLPSTLSAPPSSLGGSLSSLVCVSLLLVQCWAIRVQSADLVLGHPLGSWLLRLRHSYQTPFLCGGCALLCCCLWFWLNSPQPFHLGFCCQDCGIMREVWLLWDPLVSFCLLLPLLAQGHLF